MISILIPAAGASRRMRGRDKLLEPVNGTPLLVQMINRALPHGRVLVTLPNKDHPRAAVIPPEVERLIIPDADTGMSASLKRGAEHLKGGDMMVLIPDMPAIQSADIAAVLAARDSFPDALIWQAACADMTPGHPVLFHMSLLPEFSDLTGDSGASSIVKRHRDTRVLVPLADGRARLDLDTPEDWDSWSS